MCWRKYKRTGSTLRQRFFSSSKATWCSSLETSLSLLFRTIETPDTYLCLTFTSIFTVRFSLKGHISTCILQVLMISSTKIHDTSVMFNSTIEEYLAFTWKKIRRWWSWESWRKRKISSESWKIARWTIKRFGRATTKKMKRSGRSILSIRCPVDKKIWKNNDNHSAIKRRVKQYICIAAAISLHFFIELFHVDVPDFIIVNFIPPAVFLHVAPVMASLYYTLMHYHSTKGVLAITSALVAGYCHVGFKREWVWDFYWVCVLFAKLRSLQVDY